MAGRYGSRTAFISCTAAIITVVLTSLTTWTASAFYDGLSGDDDVRFSFIYVDHGFDGFKQMVADLDKMSAIAPMRQSSEVTPRGLSFADVLFESHRQPGQEWRDAATVYRHIDPGRRLI